LQSKHSASHSGKFFEVPADYVASYLTPAPPAAKSYDQQSALRDFAYPLTEFEFAFTRSRRMMIRDDGLVAAALMRRFQQHAFPSLAPAAAPAGLKDVAATPAAAAPAALADEGSIESSLSAMVGQSAAEVEVDADRATMAQAPGDLKAFWAKKLGPKYSVGKDINARLAEVAATDAESLRGSVILLAGMARGGRSTVMHYAVMQARQSNWLVLHMPRFDLACRGGFVLAPSETQSGMYDQPLLAQKMFAELLEQEGEKLKSIKLRGDYSEVKVDELTSKDRHPNYYAHLTPTEEYPFFHVAKGTPATLHDLVAHGAQHRVQACRIVDAFFEELDQVTEFPVLVALDGVNAYDDVTGYVEPTTRTAIPIDRLVFPKSAGRFRLRGPKNGMTLMSHTSTARTDRSGYLFKGNHVRTLNVQPYTVQELRHCVMHYASSGCFNYPIVDRQFVGEISVMTNRLPNEVRKYCELLAVE
jgi:hypothetical protein